MARSGPQQHLQRAVNTSSHRSSATPLEQRHPGMPISVSDGRGACRCRVLRLAQEAALPIKRRAHASRASVQIRPLKSCFGPVENCRHGRNRPFVVRRTPLDCPNIATRRPDVNPKRVAFLIYPAIQALDIAGPMDALAAARIGADSRVGKPGYDLVTIGFTTRAVPAESGLLLKPRFTVHTAPPFDTLVIPGGCGMRDPRMRDAVGRWIQEFPRVPRRIAAICTGVFGLASSGLL